MLPEKRAHVRKDFCQEQSRVTIEVFNTQGHTTPGWRQGTHTHRGMLPQDGDGDLTYTGARPSRMQTGTLHTQGHTAPGFRQGPYTHTGTLPQDGDGDLTHTGHTAPGWKQGPYTHRGILPQGGDRDLTHRGMLSQLGTWHTRAATEYGELAHELFPFFLSKISAFDFRIICSLSHKAVNLLPLETLAFHSQACLNSRESAWCKYQTGYICIQVLCVPVSLTPTLPLTDRRGRFRKKMLTFVLHY